MLKGGKKPKLFMFTIVELLTVMAILAILMALGLGVYSLATGKMAEARTRSIIEQIASALENYKAKHGYYIQQFSAPGFYLDTPTNQYPDDDFTDFLSNYEQLKNGDAELISSGTFINKYAVIDGYGNHLIYKCPGENNTETFDLISGGSDNTTTEDDISNFK